MPRQWVEGNKEGGGETDKSPYTGVKRERDREMRMRMTG